MLMLSSPISTTVRYSSPQHIEQHRKEVGLEVSVESLAYVFTSLQQNVGQNLNMQIANKSFENIAEFRYLGTTPTNKNGVRD